MINAENARTIRDATDVWPPHDDTPRMVIRDLAETVITQAEQIQAVLNMHVKDRDGWCQGCSYAYPCPTVRVMKDSQ